ncbi:VWA domain-containing protein, partial [Methanoculleus sp. DTU007]|uniref:vWA domain-containing protein n=1 Tax=Methanoculleus sp. DTU007 TaxID=1671626 RepID=UPI000AE060D1
GETVTFAIVSTNCTPYFQTMEPELAATSGETDGDGYAIVEFRPGAFTTDRNDPRWSDTATGTATVRATWGNISRDIVLTWKNYPYLSVETEVSPETVAVNDTVDVTIRVKGDGWALQPDPIDVVLVIDRSSSMTGKDVWPSRIAAAKSAAQIFVGEMNQDRDRIGLVSYSKKTYKDLPLTDDYSGVNETIEGLNTKSGTGTRKGLYVAIQEMVDNKNSDPDAVHAVVLMTDGEYNYYGDPLARGNGYTVDFFGWGSSNDYTIFPDLGGQQNLADYAKNNGIQLYMISFSKDLSEGDHTWETMDTLAEETGGKHYHADTAEELAQVYTEIAGELKTEAGVDTELDVVFENVEVNGNFTSGTGVFDYVHEDGVSTTIESWVDNETGHHEIIPRYTRDDTPNWTASNPHLPFNIGTVRLGQTWETTFRLAVKTEGNINVFGPGSTISFNNGTDTLALPDTFITAYPLNNTGLDFRSLEISNLRFTGVEPVTEFLPVAWDLNYTGLYTVTEDLFYSNNNGYSWVKFDTRHATNTTTHDTSTLDVRGLPAGKYIIRVTGYAPDTGDSSAWLDQEVVVGTNRSAYIQIQ